MDDTKDDHFAVNNSVMDHIRVSHEWNTPDARPLRDFRCGFGKQGDPFKNAPDAAFEPLCRKWIFNSNAVQNRIKLGEREL